MTLYNLLPRYIGSIPFAKSYARFLPQTVSCAGIESTAWFGCIITIIYLSLFVSFYKKTYTPKQKLSKEIAGISPNEQAKPNKGFPLHIISLAQNVCKKFSFLAIISIFDTATFPGQIIPTGFARYLLVLASALGAPSVKRNTDCSNRTAPNLDGIAFAIAGQTQDGQPLNSWLDYMEIRGGQIRQIQANGYGWYPKPKQDLAWNNIFKACKGAQPNWYSFSSANGSMELAAVAIDESGNMVLSANDSATDFILTCEQVSSKVSSFIGRNCTFQMVLNGSDLELF
ncbi:hypothetical protein M422DRAFT_260764 [Sphaerobolus stellatus SS14]|uniref:Uncharacterized protein n=1 Tax=Sphaerobolus stellatus (strain SS14) TaxID=990650 RepID=A0A0C9U298_SPHS4|nr:hypothetical protein M422DRAFT_260764 [Sphaerobolus stellatus SS14]